MSSESSDDSGSDSRSESSADSESSGDVVEVASVAGVGYAGVPAMAEGFE